MAHNHNLQSGCHSTGDALSSLTFRWPIPGYQLSICLLKVRLVIDKQIENVCKQHIMQQDVTKAYQKLVSLKR